MLFKSYYVWSAEIWEGSLSSAVGMTSGGIRVNEEWLPIPVSIARLGAGFKDQIKLYVDLQSCSDDEKQKIINTKSGTIRIEAPDQAISLQGNKQLLFIGPSGILQALPVLLALARTGTQVEVYGMRQADKSATNALRSYVKRLGFPFYSIRGGGDRSIAKFVSSQTVGARIMAFCDWSDYTRIKHIAREAGYSNAEIQGVGFGEKEERVFCACCYKIQLKLGGNEMICAKCGTSLVISSHYSPRLEACMGYINVI